MVTRREQAPQELIGPFSGLSFDDLRTLVEFVRDVDHDLGMGVEALDVILGDLLSWQKQINPSERFQVHEAIWHATCEWDL